MDYTVKDLPKSKLSREKLKENSFSSLTKVELLSIILRTGTSGKKVKKLSHVEERAHDMKFMKSEKARTILLSSGNKILREKDIEVTEEVIDLGRKLDVQVLNHVIVEEEIYSMRKESTVEF